MSRGFLSGVVMGGIVGSLGLAVASQMAPPPAAPRPETAEAAPPPVPPAADPVPQRAAAGPATDLAPPAGSEFARPLPEVTPVLPRADEGVPRAAVPAVALPEAREPEAPDTASAARPQPAPLEPPAPPAPAADAARPQLPAAAPATATARPEELAQPGAPSAEALPAAAELPPPPPLTPEELALIAGTAPPAPRRIEPDPPKVPGQPAASALPQAGVPAAPAAVDEAEAPPIRRFARPFESTDRPRLAILLRDTGGEVDREALAALNFPVSFVLDPEAPDAAAAAAIYRAAGQEVLMLATGLPERAQPRDAETALEAASVALPEAVALIDLPEGGFQGARSLSEQVVRILEAQGRGLVTHERGLNAADQLARREGLPSATVFRRLDGGGEDAAAVRRMLDRAAFKAGQDGQAVVIGDTRPETLKALMEWSLEGRADAVALAPATAVMR